MVHDRIPYVYRVVTNDGKVYIGSRTANKFKSGWNPYEDEAWNNFVKEYA